MPTSVQPSSFSPEALRATPALLKLDLYCRGARLDDSCIDGESTGRGLLRTRAGLGSGLEAVLPGGLWTNIPVLEGFARRSPYVIRRDAGQIWLERDGDRIAPLTLSPRPAWYDARTSSGKPMTRVGTLQGTYLGIYPARVCDYWVATPAKVNCHFCSVGLNLGVDDATEKSVDEVLEVVRAARRESGITYVDFNTGHYEGDTYLDILEPYVIRIKRETGLLVGIQTPPHHDLSRYDALRELGVNRVSFCFEIFDPARFREVCPGKAAEYGLERYLEAIRYCAALGARGPSSEPWVTNGEIIAGLEPPESSIRAIDWITSVGAIPTVCVFRPLRGTDYADLDPPDTEAMVPVFARLYEACMEAGLPIGCAPNIHVSLVMLPEECAGLSSARFPWQSLKLAAMKRVFAAQFRARLRRVEAATALPAGPGK
ncbi:MAG: radical SAM protein [Acidobacteriota bacterium]